MDNRKLKLLVMPNCQELGEKIAKELKRLNFNQVGVTIFVADDELKSAPKEAEESQYTLYRYNIHFEDIQNIDIDHHDLNQYKTVIKE